MNICPRQIIRLLNKTESAQKPERYEVPKDYTGMFAYSAQL